VVNPGRDRLVKRFRSWDRGEPGREWAATGEIVAFLDHDATADRDWLKFFADSYADDAVVGVGGLTLPNWDTSRPAWFPREFDWVLGCNYLGMPQSRQPVRNLLGGNASFRKPVFAVAGGFTTNVGRSEASLPLGGEEIEFCIRISQRRPRPTRDMAGTRTVLRWKATKRRADDSSMTAGDAGVPMTLSYRLEAGVSVVSIAGEVDIYTSSRLRESLLRVVTDEKFGGLVVNLSELRFVDSTGIGVLVGVWRRVRATGCEMTLAAPSLAVGAVLETAGLRKILGVHDAEAQAVQAVRPSAR
jgi:anti-anti-sigma factor